MSCILSAAGVALLSIGCTTEAKGALDTVTEIKNKIILIFIKKQDGRSVKLPHKKSKPVRQQTFSDHFAQLSNKIHAIFKLKKGLTKS